MDNCTFYFLFYGFVLTWLQLQRSIDFLKSHNYGNIVVPIGTEFNSFAMQTVMKRLEEHSPRRAMVVPLKYITRVTWKRRIDRFLGHSTLRGTMKRARLLMPSGAFSGTRYLLCKLRIGCWQFLFPSLRGRYHISGVYTISCEGCAALYWVCFSHTRHQCGICADTTV